MRRDWWNKEFRILMALGDSITAGGWSSTRNRCWASLLARMISDYQRLPVHLINLGIGATVLSTKGPGHAASGKPAGSERIDDQVLGYMANGNPLRPDLLVIAYGLNDARGGLPAARYGPEVEAVVGRVREKIQPLIVLCGPYYIVDFQLGGPIWSHATRQTLDDYNAVIRATAQETGCLFVDLLDTFGDADWLVHHDTVHSNDLGHRLAANRIFEVLARNCSGLALETRYVEDHIVAWRDEARLTEEFVRHRASQYRAGPP